jgi:acyl-CoA synthetase (AMP-forming)/AMP-acid ligase II
VAGDGYPLPFGYGDVARFLSGTVELNRPAAAGFDDVVGDVAGLGLAAGTPVVICLSNGRRLLDLYFAVLLTGGVPLTVSPATSSARIAALAREMGAGAVVAARPDPRRYDCDGVVAVGDAQAVVLPVRYRRAGRPGTVLMSTSGTSGLFSACLHRVDSLVRNARRHADAVGLTSRDTVLVSLPLFYSYAIVAQALAALVTGARLVVSGPPFSPEAYHAAVARYAVTSSSLTPTITRLLLAQGRPLPAGLRMLTVGGDRIAPQHVAGLRASNPDVQLYVTYGLTEAGPRVSTLAAHGEPAARYGSVGVPLDGVAVRLRGAPPSGTAAELLVSSDTVMLAKLGGPHAERTLVEPGVVATGDLFRIDDGYLYFEGRLSDFVVVRGEKVSLHAVRQFVQSLPDVVRCTTQVGVDASGTTHYDLDVGVTGGTDSARQRIRRAVDSFLLTGERPRDITVHEADLAVFQK